MRAIRRIRQSWTGFSAKRRGDEDGCPDRFRPSPRPALIPQIAPPGAPEFLAPRRENALYWLQSRRSPGRPGPARCVSARQTQEETMAKLTAKENYLRVGRGEIPEWVPTFMPYRDHGVSTMAAGPFQITSGQAEMIAGWQQPHGDWKDLWGANYTFEAGMNAGLPKPNAFILDDVTKWQSVIKHPAVPQHDWAAMAKAELDKIDRQNIAVAAELGFQPFQQLVAFMGFTEALVALYEEPDSCIDLLNYMADWYIPRIKTTLDYWKPDVMTMGDDTAAQANPFFSIEIYNKIFLPVYKRITAPVRERGVLINFHNCGRSEDFVGGMIDAGANYWNPCQDQNNLAAVQAKFGSKIAITGGWKYDIKLSDSESTVRGYVRQYLDSYAKNGGFIAMAFAGDFMGGPEAFQKWAPVNEWINDEIYTYGTKIYEGRFQA
jgi:hypothetical protein